MSASNSLQSYFLSALLAFTTALSAEEADDLGTVTIENSSHFILESSAIGQNFEIDIALPRGYSDSDNAYPVIYVTDGRLYFSIVASNTYILQLAGEIPPSIIVGIGYPGDVIESGTLRQRDLTPTVNNPNSGIPEGGADQFLEFIEDSVKPFVNSNFRTDQNRETLVGHSLGGLFAIYALFDERDLFENYVISSPSIWWGNNSGFEYEEAYAQIHSTLEKRVFISSAELEEMEGDKTQMVTNARILYQNLNRREYPDLSLEYVLFNDETHLSVMAPATIRGLKFVLN